MPSPRPLIPPSRRGRALLLLGFWTVFALAMLAHGYLVLRVRGRPMDPVTMLYVAGGAIYWAPLTPLVVWLARRFPVERPAWGRRLGLHAVFSFATNVLGVGAFLGLASLVGTPPGTPETWNERLVAGLLSTFFFHQLIYAGILTMTHAHAYYLRVQRYQAEVRERDVRAAQLETRLADARLRALRMQLNPHFLFNTLNAVSSLVTKDPGGARRMLAQLSRLLRLTLDRSSEDRVTLAEELDFLGHYLRIEEVRFADRLQVEIDVPEPLLDARVPNLLLQPLVENALKHGIAPYDAPGTVRIAATARDGALELRVCDSGPGLSGETHSALPGAGIGLRNTRERLQQRYGDAARLDLLPLDEGFCARILLPLEGVEHADEPSPRLAEGPAAP